MPNDENNPRREELRARLRNKIGAKREERNGGGGHEGGVRQGAERAVMAAAGEDPQLLAFAQQALRDPRAALNVLKQVGGEKEMGPSSGPKEEEEEGEEGPPPSDI